MNNKVQKPTRPCLHAAVSILEYADNTERQLSEKLEKRGYPKEEISDAIAFLKEKRLFSERDYAYRYALSAANTKKWGPRRILSSMREKGFAKENIQAVESIMGRTFPGSESAPATGSDNSAIENLLSSLDFPAICAILIGNTLHAAAYAPLREYFETGDLPAEKADRQKLYALRQKLRSALLRRGFPGDTIRDAEEIAMEKLRGSHGEE